MRPQPTSVTAAVRPHLLRLATLALVVGAACSSLPGRSPAERPLRVVVLSDLNSAYGSTAYAAEVHAMVARTVGQWRPDLVLIAGDMIAGQRTTLTDANVRAMWRAFDSAVAQPLRAAGIPFVVTLGNHDASGHPAHARDRRLAADYWRDPAHAAGAPVLPGGRFPFHYAVRHHDVFVLVLDASTGGVAHDTAQLAWIERTLASPAARTARLRVALGHVPLHAVADAGRNRAGEVQDRPEVLRELLLRGDVRLLVSGHHHAWYPARDGALLLLHAGLLGEGPRPLIGSQTTSFKTVTVLELLPDRDSIAEHTWAVSGDSLRALDVRDLPPHIDGINGRVVRRDLAR